MLTILSLSARARAPRHDEDSEVEAIYNLPGSRYIPSTPVYRSISEKGLRGKTQNKEYQTKTCHSVFPKVFAPDAREWWGRLAAVSYTHLRAHETRHDLVCRLLLEKKMRRNGHENRLRKAQRKCNLLHLLLPASWGGHSALWPENRCRHGSCSAHGTSRHRDSPSRESRVSSARADYIIFICEG